MSKICLIWLEWPEKCFRIDAEALRYLKGLVSAGTRVVRVRSEAEFLKRLPLASSAIVWHFRKEWYALATRLEMLATPGAGRELVSTAAPPSVRLHFGHFHGEIMSESVVGFMLAWARGFFAVRAFSGFGGTVRPRVRGWPREELSDCCYTIAGTRAVVVGYGRVGRAIGDKLSALGVKVTGVTRHGIFGDGAQRTEKECYGTADWLIFALPSDTGTDNYLDAALIRKLPRSCVVINVGRGNAIDEVALTKALSSGRLAGAYLDVFKGEPGPLQSIVSQGKSGGILSENLGTGPRNLKANLGTGPKNMIKMPHSSAFSRDYLLRCFEELKNDGCI